MLDQGVVREVINYEFEEVFDQGVVLESVLKHSLFLSYCFIFFDKLIVCNKLCIFLGRYFV